MHKLKRVNVGMRVWLKPPESRKIAYLAQEGYDLPLEVEQQLQTPICIVGSSGGELLQALKGEGEAVKKRWNPYS